MSEHFANNLSKLEPNLVRCGNYDSEGVEYPVFSRHEPGQAWIDVFAADSSGGLVVIECKLGTANHSAAGQVAAYVGALRERFPKNKVRIRAFIVCRRVAPTLWYALREITRFKVEVFVYENDMSVARLKPPRRSRHTHH